MNEPKKRFGEILIEKGMITPMQLDEAIFKQATIMSHRKLGQILVCLGHIGQIHVNEILTGQGIDPDSSNPRTSPKHYEPVTDLFVELPLYEAPTVSIGIESINEYSGIRYCLMGGVNLYRQPEESDEDLAKRAGKEIEVKVLRALKENPKEDGDPTRFRVKQHPISMNLDSLAESLEHLDDKEKDAPLNE